MALARSPMACTATWSRAESADCTHRWMESSGVVSRPRVFGASRYGSNRSAVVEPSEPSMYPFTPSMRSQSSPGPICATVSATQRHWSIGKNILVRTVSVPAARARWNAPSQAVGALM